MADALWSLTAAEAVDALAAVRVTPADLIDALEARTGAVDPVLNALPTRAFDRARAAARALTARPPAGRGVLHGLPLPVKDSYAVAGVRTTWGSAAFADHVPDRSDLVVEALEAAGGIVCAKSNTPEFEAGASTFNAVFGITRNPWNTALSPAGSSGGAAAAVASGMAFVAQGSDFACSLRYPAAFCGVVAIRPTPGLVPQGPSRLPQQVLSVIGPLGRTVEDAALLLDALAAFDPRDPLTRPPPGPPGRFRAAARAPRPPARAAFSPDLGFAPVDPSIAAAVRGAAGRLEAAGLAVDEPPIDLAAADPVFRTLRAFQFAALWGHVLDRHRDRLKPEVAANIEAGLALGARALAAAEAGRARLRLSFLAFLDRHGPLIAPAAPVPPFPAEERFVTRIGGREMGDYLGWLALGYAITLTGCPAIALPCARTAGGLPIGLQIVGAPWQEEALISAAAWAESVLGMALRRPIDPRPPPPGPVA